MIRKVKLQWWGTGLENRRRRKAQWFDSTSFLRMETDCSMAPHPIATRDTRKGEGFDSSFLRCSFGSFFMLV